MNRLDSLINYLLSERGDSGRIEIPDTEQDKAAEIAVRTVREFRKSHDIQVIFNVFRKEDHKYYSKLLGGN